MAKLIKSLFCCIVFAYSAMAQVPLNDQAYTDSLSAILNGQHNDSSKSGAAFQLTEYYAQKDTIRAMQYLQQSRAWLGNSPLLHALYPYYYGLLLARTQPPLAEAQFLLADSLLKKIPGSVSCGFQARAWQKYGVLQQVKDNEEAYMDIIIHKVMPLARQAGDSIFIGKSLLDLGIVFKNNAKRDKAEAYCLEAISVLKGREGAESLLVEVYYTIAENNILSGKNPQARAMLDSAWVLLSPYPESDKVIDYYGAEGMYYTMQAQFDKALGSLDKGIQLARRRGLRYEGQRLELQQFYAYYNQKNFAKAKEVMLRLMQQPEMMARANNRIQLYYGLAETYRALGQMTPAYQWLMSFSQLSDSLSASRSRNEISALEAKYRNAESRKRISVLEAASESSSLSARNTLLTLWLLAAVSIALVIASAFTLFYYRNNKKLSEQKEINYQQQLREMEQQQQLGISRAMLEGEERERRRVARDLHDGLGGMLAGVKIKLSNLGAGHDHHAALHNIVGQLDSSMKELRLIARNLMPESLLKFGLETALKDLCESLRSEHTQIDFQAFGIEPDIAEPVQVTIYRIVQETLTNAIRHANASEILLQCSQNGDAFFITVEDNGKGFDLSGIANAAGIGMSNIKNRVKYLKGKLDISSVLNEGTTINIELNVGD
ncbi:tetratricopeptide repeat-containing sensor histidine kinase [Chitinophaga solisilvae]|uniref:tetratricopeptide repeat-containing sensor histidine kinase n=1 Tax=Chitinophaga solisilvae TaxID=1233460 RepID=UPI001370A310|nr:ATP-binding protein [Chitinophaga solisilvae]